MERDGDQGPDAASIKPVSSLRAKFENLQTQHPKKSGANDHVNANAYTGGSSSAAGLLTPGDPVKQATLMRSSLDLPRPVSPWAASTTTAGRPQPLPKPLIPESSHGRPDSTTSVTRPTASPAGRNSTSPARSAHKRPLSMHIQSSPKMGPAVQVDSPRSPPSRNLYHSPSPSPERRSNTRHLKSAAMSSQNPSSSSSRAVTPGVEDIAFTSDQLAARRPSTEVSRSGSPVPPVVNRADKPKIPAKPQSISSNLETGLSAKPSLFSSERKVSPFSTPPSSDEERIPSPDFNTLNQPRTSSTVPGAISSLSQQVAVTSQDPRSSRDPRNMGFSAPKITTERTDPRLLGFSASPSVPARNSTRTRPDQSPARKIPPARSTTADPRVLGFESPRPNIQVASHTGPQSATDRFTRPQPSQLQTRAAMMKDPRAMGFSNSSTPTTPVRSEQLATTTPKMPPPRPSEDSKRPVYAPGISRTINNSVTSAPAAVQAQKSDNSARTPASIPTTTNFLPPPKRNASNDNQEATPELSRLKAPALPRRRSFDARPLEATDSDDAEQAMPEPITSRQDYPNASNSNRRPPIIDPDRWQVNAKTDGKAYDMCGKLLCCGGYHTRVYDTSSGEELVHLNHGETVKTTTVVFKPGADIKAEGKRIWLGNNIGDISEIDLETSVAITHSTAHNRVEIFKILRHHRDLWTLDEAGKLFVWPADESGVPNLKYSHISHKLLSKPTYAMVVQDTLWVATGKELRVYRPGHDAAFNAYKGVLPAAANVADVTCGTYTDHGQGKAYIGHADGKITMYKLDDYSCLGSVKVSDYKINSLALVGDKLWAVFKTGKVYVYDTSAKPWKVLKDWKAHEGPATSILLDPSSVWLLGRLQIATTGHDGFVRLWDGMLEEDWLEGELQARCQDFCTFRDVKAAVTTWNAGAVSPAMLKTHFIADAIHAAAADPPEILVFGFQEVVDLEDKSMTAKSLFGFGKKKESRVTDNQQYQSRVYRDWRDYLSRCINQYLPQHNYVELHTSSLIGLFSCVFVRGNERRNITKDARREVKCGMGGHYGNKGALLCRFVLDSSSLCFVNCHLAAGQSHTAHRNNDVATILESDGLPPEPDLDLRTSLFVGGGDGRQILDHEICILNGDLNYRIDTLPRATVIKHIVNNNLTELLRRDQLNISRQRVAGFRLAPFIELPLTFPPTYKYDVGSDDYDSSEKKRSPAWCDRILFRAPTSEGKCRVKQLEYVRHEGVRYSDHRPVSGLFRITVKKVDDGRRKQALKTAYAEFEKLRKATLEDGCVRYLVYSFGIDKTEARSLIRSSK